MGAPSLFSVLVLGLLSGTIGTELEPSSVTAQKHKVVHFTSSVDTVENYTWTKNVPKNGEALLKELQARLTNHSLRVEQLEEDVARMNKNLSDQTFIIKELSQQLEVVQSLLTCVGEPPSTRNGRPKDFERTHGSEVSYECEKDFVVTGNSTVRCHFGKWDGQPPLCSLLTCVGEPPSIRNGRPKNFERKHGSEVSYECDENFVVTGNSTVRCQFGKWEGQPPVCSRPALLDATLTLHAHMDWMPGESNISCYSEKSDQEIDFSRVLDTGTGWALPNASKTYVKGRATVLELSGGFQDDKPGVYECGYDMEGKRAGITFQVEKYGGIVWPKLLTVGDTMEFGSGLPDAPSWRWLHNGQRVPAWDGLTKVKIAGVRKEDAGTYELYAEGDKRHHYVFSRLVVRACPANLFGERCDRNCSTCYNGGQCDVLLGTCVCPPGFRGDQCEVACGEDRVGSDCSQTCEGEYCSQHLFCRPDPYGCSCASGYEGHICKNECKKGTFGANCELSCHCKEGSCDPYTGACTGGCSQGWTGPSCQIPVGK